MNATNISFDLNGNDDEEENTKETLVGIVPTKIYIGLIYFILAFGSLGNSCISALMQQDREFRSLSYSVYLRVLAVFDNLLLALVGTEDILEHRYYRLNDFLTFSTVFCKLWSFFVFSVRLISPWLVVGLTFDRFVAVAFPLERFRFCSRRTALTVCVLIVGITFAVSAVIPVVYRIDDGECGVPEWTWLRNYAIVRSVFLETTIPCILILLLNLYIIVTINRSRMFRAATVAWSGQLAKEKTSRLDPATLSLMAVSLMAFVTLVPICILQVTEWSLEKQIIRLERSLGPNNTAQDGDLQSLVHLYYEIGDYWPAFNLVYLCNFGHNFYIMVLSGHKYRQKVASWFQCICHLRRSKGSARVTYRDTQETKAGDSSQT